MAKEMLINVSEGEECRIALLEDGKLEELYMERTSSTSHVGNIYKGRVTNVEASIQAAFVDFGLGRNGFLHISDLLPQYFGRKGEEVQEAVGRKMARRDRPPIQRCLRRGDEIVVQIIKEGIGTKGPTLSTYLSIPGRILVMMPGMTKMGVSRKIEDEAERRRLRQILDSLKPPEDVGFIIRTAGVGKTKAEIERDFKFLLRLWDQIQKVRKSTPAPVELYTEGDLVTRTVRDVYSSDIDRIIVDSKEVAERVKEFIKISAPRTRNRVELYDQPIPLFHKYGIEQEIELMHSRYVPLPSGGSLVIDSTEAVVAIDVNSGKFREHNDAEMTAFKTDLEAADEICRQLKLRDLGGVVICDFIDLRYERHRRELERRLNENFKRDRAKTKVLRMSEFGIIELTRQRMRPSLKRSVYFDCPHCKGHGLVKTPESMSLDVMRRLAIAINDARVTRVEISVCAEIAFYLQNKKRGAIANLEATTGKRVIVRVDPHLALDEVRFDLYDAREGLVTLETLGVMPSDQALQKADPRMRQQHTQRHGRSRHRPLPRPAEAEISADDLFEEDDHHDLDTRGGRGESRSAAGEASEGGAAATGAEAAAVGGENGQNGEGGGRRRRRRRRGGRGRRRGHGHDPRTGEVYPLESELRAGSEQTDIDAEYEPRDDEGEIAAGELADARAQAGMADQCEGLSESAEALRRAPEAAFAVEPADEPVEAAAAPADPVEPVADEPVEAVADEPAAEEPASPAASATDEQQKKPRRRRPQRRRGGTAAKAEAAVEAPVADEPIVEQSGAAARDAGAEAAAEAPPAEEKSARPARRTTRKSSKRTTRSTKAAESKTASDATAEAPATTARAASSKPEADKVEPAKVEASRGEAARTEAATTASASAKPATSKPVAPPRAVIPPLPVTRTGSADRHLVDDVEDIPTRPVSRPRSYRDLDAIPDDFD